MKWQVLALVLCALVCFAFADDVEDTKRGEEKLSRLLAESKKNPLRNVNDAEFIHFVQDGPRPYSLFVFLTQSGGGCKLCGDMQPEVRLVAQAYENARFEPNGTEPRHQVFFLRLDAARNYELFSKMGMNTIPHLIYVPPTNSNKRIKWGKLLNDKLGIYMGWTADVLVKLTQSRAHLPFTVSVERPPEPLDWTPALLMLISIGGLTTFFLTIGRPFIDLYLRNSVLYLIIALGVYAYCAGGGMYNVLRETQWMHVGQNGDVSYIYPGSHNQFGAESYIVGFLYLVCGFFCVLMNTRLLTYNTTPGSRNLLIFLCCVLFHLFYRQLRFIYTRKNGSYNMGYVWDTNGMMWE